MFIYSNRKAPQFFFSQKIARNWPGEDSRTHEFGHRNVIVPLRLVTFSWCYGQQISPDNFLPMCRIYSIFHFSVSNNKKIWLASGCCSNVINCNNVVQNDWILAWRIKRAGNQRHPSRGIFEQIRQFSYLYIYIFFILMRKAGGN